MSGSNGGRSTVGGRGVNCPMTRNGRNRSLPLRELSPRSSHSRIGVVLYTKDRCASHATKTTPSGKSTLSSMESQGPRPLKAFPFGLPLFALIRRDPLGAVQRFQAEFGDVAALEIAGQPLVYFFQPEAARQVLVDNHSDFTRDARQLKIFQSFQGKNVITVEGPDWERQRRILTPGFSPKRIAAYMTLMADATEACARAVLPTRRGDSTNIDVDALTTRITMDAILRALFSYAAK